MKKKFYRYSETKLLRLRNFFVKINDCRSLSRRSIAENSKLYIKVMTVVLCALVQGSPKYFYIYIYINICVLSYMNFELVIKY